MFFLNLFNIKDRKTTTIHEAKLQRSMHGIDKSLLWVTALGLSANMSQVFWQLIGGTSEWGKNVLGSVSAYRTHR